VTQIILHAYVTVAHGASTLDVRLLSACSRASKLMFTGRVESSHRTSTEVYMVHLLTRSLEQIDAVIVRSELRISRLVAEVFPGSDAELTSGSVAAVSRSLPIYWSRRQQLLRAEEALELASNAVQASAQAALQRTGMIPALGTDQLLQRLREEADHEGRIPQHHTTS
jgi:hypothetical protein